MSNVLVLTLAIHINRGSVVIKQIKTRFFYIRAENSNLAKSLGEKSNPAMYQDENLHRYSLSLQN